MRPKLVAKLIVPGDLEKQANDVIDRAFLWQDFDDQFVEASRQPIKPEVTLVIKPAVTLERMLDWAVLKGADIEEMLRRCHMYGRDYYREIAQ
jgi:hypothetical protein